MISLPSPHERQSCCLLSLEMVCGLPSSAFATVILPLPIDLTPSPPPPRPPRDGACSFPLIVPPRNTSERSPRRRAELRGTECDWRPIAGAPHAVREVHRLEAHALGHHLQPGAVARERHTLLPASVTPAAIASPPPVAEVSSCVAAGSTRRVHEPPRGVDAANLVTSLNN